MTIKLDKEAEQAMLASIKQFFADRLDDEIGDLKARQVLEFFVAEIAPGVYNQAIADAQEYFHDKTADLAGLRYAPEFDYWKT